MQKEYFPDKKTVEEAMKVNDPLLMLVAYDRSKLIVSSIDDAFEHIILLKKMNYPETDIDKYFRVVVNREGADWTFVCPSDYKGISDKNVRIREFYKDGINIITEALNLIGYNNVQITIPRRYRRHFNMLGE